MDTFWQDIRYSIRILKKSPGFTAIAVMTLALGIGANAAMFSVVNAILIQPLRYKDADRLVVLNHFYPKLKLKADVSAPGYVHYRDNNRVFENMAAFRLADLNLTGRGEPERLRGMLVSANFFDTLATAPVLGRGFAPDEAQPGHETVAVLGYGLYERRFGGDPNILQQEVRLDGKSYRVIGIMPETFRLGLEFDNEMEIFLPITFTPQQLAPERWTTENLEILARLKPAVTMDQAQADMNSIAAGLKERFGRDLPFQLALRSLQDDMVGSIRPALVILLAAVGCVLLIACANVANLLLARGAGREKEIAVRAAVGGRRYRIIRQFMTESLVLALLGGVAGLVLAFWSVDALVALNSGFGQARIPRANEIRLDGIVLLFSFGLTVLTGLIFGLVPAVRFSHCDLQETLKDSRRTPGGRSRRFQDTLIVSQIAIALVLLTGAALLIESFRRVQGIDPGFDANNLLVLHISLPNFNYGEQEVRAFFDEALLKIRGVPAVQSADAISHLPLSDYHDSASFRIEGRQLAPLQPHGDKWRVSDGYFRTMRIPLRSGRFFNEHDMAAAATVVIIDETLRRRYFPNEDPIGKRITFQAGGSDRTAEIVGVVGHVKHWSLDRENPVQYYLSQRQIPLNSMFLVVRTAGDPMRFVSAVREAIRAVDSDLPVYRVSNMADIVASSLIQRRMSTLLLGIFASIALIMATVGLYGVMSYAVAQRTREIGIRIAIGAVQFNVLRMIVSQGMGLVLAGLLTGLAGAFALTRLMSGLLFDVSATDPFTFVVVSVILSACALAASLIPAHRATRVDPIVALRYE